MLFRSNGGVASREWKNRPVTSNLPLRSGKGHLYEGGIRVPLIVRWPGTVAPGGTSPVPVHAVDFYPTYAELAGAVPPAGHRLDGESLLPLWRGGGALRRSALYWHMPTYTVMYGRTPCAVIRQGDWKLIHWMEKDEIELFNLSKDISEQNNVAAQHPEIVNRLKAFFLKLPPEHQRRLVLAGSLLGVVGLILLMAAVVPEPRKLEPRKTRIKTLLTDADPRALGIDGLASELRE